MFYYVIINKNNNNNILVRKIFDNKLLNRENSLESYYNTICTRRAKSFLCVNNNKKIEYFNIESTLTLTTVKDKKCATNTARAIHSLAVLNREKRTPHRGRLSIYAVIRTIYVIKSAICGCQQFSARSARREETKAFRYSRNDGSTSTAFGLSSGNTPTAGGSISKGLLPLRCP